jgi:subtilisin family serine protease
MFRILIRTGLFISLFAVAGAVLETQAGQAPSLGHVTDHVLVRFNPEQVRTRFGTMERYDCGMVVDRLALSAGCRLEETAFARWERNKRGQKQRDNGDPGIDLSGFMYLKLPHGMSPEDCVAQLKGNPLFDYVGVDPIGIAGSTPNDPQYPAQWHLAGTNGYAGRIHAPEAWDITTGTSDVIVAVLDTGCNTNSVELAGRTVPGYDFINDDNDPADDNGHGTMVASIICAKANNSSYGAGIDWHCRLMPVKVLKSDSTGGYSYWVQGINWAVTNGAKIINLSAGGTDWDYNLHTAITNAVAHGVIFVTITHNYPALGILYPGFDPASITVGGTDTNGQRCFFSAYGTNIDLVAPGTNIYTISTGNVWNAWSGTSFAGAQVSGVAALICSIRPELNSEQVRNLLCAGADDQCDSDTNDIPGFDIYYGWGRLNAYNSIVLAETEFDTISRATNGDIILSWKCPPNASNKLPYKLEYTADLRTNGWISASNIACGSSLASWTDSPTNSTSRFYRIRVREP